MNSGNNFVRKWDEQLKLLLYFAIVTAVGGLLFKTLGMGWRQSNFVKPVIYGASLILNLGFQRVVVAFFGGFLGILLLLTVDPKKRWQGILLWVGMLVAVASLWTVGLFLPNLDLLSNAPWLALGIAVGVVVGGGEDLAEVTKQGSTEFRRAATLLFYAVSSIVILGLLEYHLQYPQFIGVRDGMYALIDFTWSFSIRTQGLLKNAVLAVVFVGTLRRFVQYDAETEFFVLGPRNSGKSLFLVGAYLSALEMLREDYEETSPEATGDLMDLVGEMDTATPEDGWSLAATGQSETRNLQFQYVNGQVFPRNVQLSTLDYAGEFLEDLPSALTAELDEIDNPTLQRLSQKVQQTDTLILLIDCEKFENNESLEIEPYFDILQAVDDKEIMLVATKADILGEKFREEQSLEPHNYFDEFVEYVNQQLIEYNQQVRALVQSTSGEQIHPVYYQTKKNDAGERVPMRNAKGNVMRNGFRRLLERLG